MSLDASDWVWTRSTARGTARMVLLTVADKVRDEKCVAYAGTAMLVRRTNSSRSSVRRAVDTLLASGELVEIEDESGPGGETVYKMPHAVGHVRKNPTEPPFEGTQNEPPGSNVDPGSKSAPGPTTTPLGDQIDPGGGSILNPEEGSEWPPGGSGWTRGEGSKSAPRGFKLTPHNSSSLLLEEQQPHAPARATSSPVTEHLRPLVDALGAAGVEVRWSLGLGEQREVWQLVQRHGIESLVELAAHRTAPGDAPKPARYWLKVWGDLNHAPATPPAGPAAGAGENVIPLRGRPAPASPADPLLAGLALLEQEENA